MEKKRGYKKWKSYLMIVVMCVALGLEVSHVCAEDSSSDFTIVNGVLQKYTGTDPEVAVPEGITEIAEGAFKSNKTITNVTLPSTLTTIGKNAFCDCTNLEIPVFPASVSAIGEMAFQHCSGRMENAVIPASVTYIGPWAFHLSGCEKLTINGNNSVIALHAFASGFVGQEDCSSLDHLKEAELNGTFSEVIGAFDGRAKLQNVTINGTIEKLENGFYGCESLQTLTVNGDIHQIETTVGDQNIFAHSSDLTIYGREGSDIQKYAEKYGISFVVLSLDEEEPEQKNEINLTETDTCVLKAVMQELVDNNKVNDITIRTNGGIVFVFPQNTMKMMDKEIFDFGTKVITEYDLAGTKNLARDNFAFRVHYNYSGELPGVAQVSIPVDGKWNGQELYYYQIDGNGSLIDQNISASVKNGIYTVPMNHCSDYIAVTKKISNTGGSNLPDTGGKKETVKGEGYREPENSDGKTQPEKFKQQATITPPTVVKDTDQQANMAGINERPTANTSPKTGDNFGILSYMALLFISVVAIIKCRNIIK